MHIDGGVLYLSLECLIPLAFLAGVLLLALATYGRPGKED